MSRGDPAYDDIPPAGALAELRALRSEHPALDERIAAKRAISWKYDVPYLGGISSDGATVYLDPKLKELPEWVHCLITLHEVVEWSLKPWKRDYEDRHHMATAAEDQFVTTLGHTAAQYRRLLHPYYQPIETEKIASIPPDLDLSPYSGQLRQVLYDLQHGKVSKLSVDYGHGTYHRQCGKCQMFSTPHKCSLVAGYIEASDVCNRFVRKLDDE